MPDAKKAVERQQLLQVMQCLAANPTLPIDSKNFTQIIWRAFGWRQTSKEIVEDLLNAGQKEDD